MTESGPRLSISQRSRLALSLLAIFLGQLGIHRFYTGKKKSAITMLVLCVAGYATIWAVFGYVALSALWFWNVIDIVLALSGVFLDSDGNVVSNWKSYQAAM